MNEPATSIPLILMTAASAAASGIALRRLSRLAHRDSFKLSQHTLVTLVAGGCGLVLLGRWLSLGDAWQPVHAHVDGLLLMCMLFAGAILFIQTRPKLSGLPAFALPLLTVMLGWGICASMWTYRAFNLDSIEPAWTVFHTLSTYLGLLCCAIGAIAGAMYLFVQRRLKTKTMQPGTARLASLETLESLIIHAATLGFVLLSLSLISGVMLVTRETAHHLLGPAWWTSPKVILATSAWLLYALLMNVRYASHFRGSRAAWLAIGGLLLVLSVYGAIQAIDPPPGDPSAPATRQTPDTPRGQEVRRCDYCC